MWFLANHSLLKHRRGFSSQFKMQNGECSWFGLGWPDELRAFATHYRGQRRKI